MIAASPSVDAAVLGRSHNRIAVVPCAMGDNGTQRIEDKSPVNGAIHRVGKSPNITTNATTNAIGGIRRTL